MKQREKTNMTKWLLYEARFHIYVFAIVPE